MLEDFKPEKHVEMILFNALRHEITNFRPGFPLKEIDNTYFLTDCGSDWFPLEVSGGKVFLCIPSELMAYFCFMDMINISVINKGTIDNPDYDEGYYFVFKIGNRALKKFGALRVRCSKKRSELIALSKEIHVVSVNKDGEALGIDEGRNYFKLLSRVEEIKSLHQASWEQ